VINKVGATIFYSWHSSENALSKDRPRFDLERSTKRWPGWFVVHSAFSIFPLLSC